MEEEKYKTRGRLKKKSRCCGLLEVRDEVLPFRGLLDPREHHLGPLDVLLWRQEVVEQRGLFPLDARGFVGGGVGVTLDGAGHAPEQSVQVRPLLVASALRKQTNNVRESGMYRVGAGRGKAHDRPSGGGKDGLTRQGSFDAAVTGGREGRCQN